MEPAVIVLRRKRRKEESSVAQHVSAIIIYFSGSDLYDVIHFWRCFNDETSKGVEDQDQTQIFFLVFNTICGNAIIYGVALNDGVP